MWIGSKVPPRIPIRTGSRIGLRRRDKTERPRNVGVGTPHLCHWIDVFTVDPGREMHRRMAMSYPAQSDRLTPFDPGATRHNDVTQIRNRRFESGHGFDGHRIHPRDRPGESHPTRRRRQGLGRKIRCEIGAPVPAKLSDRCITLNNRTVNRWADTYCGYQEKAEQGPPPLPNLSDDSGSF